MLYINASHNSPKVVIDFTQILFEISGDSCVDEPLAFYNPIFQYIDSHFYQVKDSIYQRANPSLTLHFYLRYVGLQDIEMIRQIDGIFFPIQEFKTYIRWYYNPNDDESVERANNVQNTFLNPIRIIPNSVIG